MTSAHGLHQLKVLVVGGGIAGLELLFALADRAADLCRTTLLSAGEEFVLRPQLVGQPWGGPPISVPLRAVCEQTGTTLQLGTAKAVDAEARVVIDADDRRHDYDVLVVCLGARPYPPYVGTPTVGLDRVPDELRTFTGTAAVIVPPGVTWSHPAYQLALLAARPGALVHVITPEAQPLQAFGTTAARATSALLARAHVPVLTSVSITPGVPLDALPELPPTRIALPLLRGPQLPGLPADELGFIPVDDDGRVTGLRNVFAAGDATDRSPKQGGLAAQRAERVAACVTELAGGAGAGAAPTVVLRGKLTRPDGTALYVRRRLDGIDPGESATEPLWYPDAAMCAWRLTNWLATRVDGATDALGPVARFEERSA